MITSEPYTLNQEDLKGVEKAANARARKELSFFNPVCILYLFAWGSMLLAIVGFFRWWHSMPHIAAIFMQEALLALAAFIALALIPHATQRLMKKYLNAHNPSLYTEHTIGIMDERICVRSAYASAELPWSTIQARAEDASNYYLFIGAIQIIVVPKRVTAALEPAFSELIAKVPAVS